MKIRKERGSVMLESTYCILISVIVLMFIMSFGFFLYQHTVVTIVANEVAEEVAQTYKLRNVTDSSTVTSSDISGIGKYRYLFFSDSFNTKNEAKLTTLANVRLTKTSLNEMDGRIKINVETVVDDIGRRHDEVTVSQRYTFLLGELLAFIGQSDSQIIERTSYVESPDVLNYVNTVKATQYGMDELSENVGFLGVIDSAISLLHSIFDH